MCHTKTTKSQNEKLYICKNIYLNKRKENNLDG